VTKPAKLWNDELAGALIGGLDRRHGARAVPLKALEADLDSRVHHTNLPIAIAIQRDRRAHVVGLVEGSKVQFDGPVPARPGYRYDEIPESIAQLEAIASDWLDHRIEDIGLVDAALAIMTKLRGKDSFAMYTSGQLVGFEGHISVLRGTNRWPAAISLQAVAGGVQLQCGESKRVVRTHADLADFADRELPQLVTQIAWCTKFVADVARAKAVAMAGLELAKRKIIDREWSLWTNESYFHFGTGRAAHLKLANATGTTAVFEPIDRGVQMTCDAYEHTFHDARDLESHADAVVTALTASVSRVTRSNLVTGAMYRVRKPFGAARAGDVLTFTGIEEYKPSGEGWRFTSPVDRGVILGDDSPELDVLADYLSPF
jgi:hypothetical protein